ncbi:TIGR03364 family FAD-dependent oxidoreductase [Aquimarina sp. TRL1]|uniref:TIGR03364 family FAD-dependent oxidoreductase n=1 Tax=Aquimarina sp. (strain TRL1) TaxID=2736252 RepID=UPI00158B33C7|nr:TIGR03364 family FAD-dependent oxidoreductase [Aquimarina sp. TRL1]QKX03901.1 TIGR03364 family FAD-dependent oxidoreductase [Aquimarina sp. TRL1]
MRAAYDLIIIGGGVLGSFHAYHALKRGLHVLLVEKDKVPRGATTQNFGQVVPSGMNTKWQAYGRQSLQLYKEIQQEFDITVREEGSVYVASNEEEMQLIEELAKINKANDYTAVLRSKKECLQILPGLNESYVVGGLQFPQEVTVEPRTMIHRLHAYMVKILGLTIQYQTTIIHCESEAGNARVQCSRGQEYIAKKVIICNGNEFKSLYPTLFAKSDLEVSKLQMMQTYPQKAYTLPGSVLTGWSIRRYEAFSECPSYREIKNNEAKESLQQMWGVHILFKQAIDGSVILGDSHQYADASDIDDLGYELDMDIDRFMIEEAKKIITLPAYEIKHRWFGMYSQCKNSDIFQKTIDDTIHIVTGIGGKGMTGSAGFAKEHINKIFNV